MKLKILVILAMKKRDTLASILYMGSAVKGVSLQHAGVLASNYNALQLSINTLDG